MSTLGPFLSIIVLWIFSLCLHEYSHARVAFEGGDYTVKDKGYLSFNPFHYVHPFLSIVLPVLFIVMTGGIALPGGAVWIESWRLRSRGWRSAVSLAGPAANVAMCIVLGLPFLVGIYVPGESTSALWPILAISCFLQASAALLNLIPLPGLDGYGAIAPFLPRDLQVTLGRFAGHSMIILLILFVGVPQFSSGFFQVVEAVIGLLRVPAAAVYDGHQMLNIIHLR